MSEIDFSIMPPRIDLRNSDQIAVYGAGNTGRMLASALRSGGYQVKFFFDRRGSPPIDGIAVTDPAVLSGERAGIVVLIGIFSTPNDCDTPAIVERLNQLGYRKVITFEELFLSGLLHFNRDFFWLTESDFYRRNRADIEAASALFDDESSRNLFNAQINHRLGGSWRDLPAAQGLDLQYLEPGLEIDRDTTFFDLGSFDGDTLRAMYRNGIRPGHVVIFEPDRGNFERVMQWVNEHLDFCPDTISLNAGAGASSRIERFQAESTGSSHITTDGGNMVPVFALDEIFLHASFKRIYIKMDIEGAETDAIRGMTGLIRKHRPDLAVSAYHRPEDIFKLPLLLKSICPEYRLRLRSYGGHCFDTVLYALNADRKK